ncbi:amidohydrolase family protein [Cohnella panacarvi]|uniref:amidohydrolase family protein n=1 Tax=Cohnella panacarvi TaxID=400776 RepID=UPI00047E3583|nr:amidohydrolase family protein [Cohnella panacarvi]
MRIDSHQHYWTIERGDYGWITPEMPKLYRDYLPEQLAGHLSKHGIAGTIAVQAAPTVEETEYLFALADRTDSILGVVGWLDLFNPSHRNHYERYKQHPKFVGFRMMIQEMPEASKVLKQAVVGALREYAREDVPVDLLLKSDQLESLNLLLNEAPGLRGVIDHIAKPPIASGSFDRWAEQMERAAAHPNIYCKLSGLVTEADHLHWKPEQFQPYIRHVLALFGPHRVMFGSDWPVCLLAAEYDEVVDVLERAIPSAWGEQERAALYGRNAAKFYKLPAMMQLFPNK